MIKSGGKREGGIQPETPDPRKTEEILVLVMLSLAGETYAIAVEKVREIIRVAKSTWIPGTYEPVLGVVNMRGSIVPVIDLAQVLSGSPVVEGQDSRIVITDSGWGVIGFLVESVKEVTNISAGDLQPVMQTLAERQKKYIEAQVNHKGSIAGILDIDQIVEDIKNSQSSFKKPISKG